MSERENILNLLPEEIEQEMERLGEEKFRGRQIFRWICRGIREFGAMTDLPKELRSRLEAHFSIESIEVLDRLHSSDGDATKYLFLLRDNNVIESVLMRYRFGNTVCLSTQVGCRMGCRFCASARGGLVRDLEPGEMLAQVIEVNRDMNPDGERAIRNIVLMGTGEPLDNYENVIKFLRLVHHPLGLNVSYRNITISTCGIVPRIRQLAKEGMPVTLSVSLHSADDEIRRQLMPGASVYSVDEIVKECRYYFEKTGRRVSFEYILIEGLNDGKGQALKLARKLKGFPCHVNVIPFNKVENAGYRRSPEVAVRRFMEVLRKEGISVTRRRELGLDIEGACGQLRRHYLEKIPGANTAINEVMPVNKGK